MTGWAHPGKAGHNQTCRRNPEASAAELTQDDLAQRFGIDASVVSKTQRREDMLLSTLVDYLSAAGVEDAKDGGACEWPRY